MKLINKNMRLTGDNKGETIVEVVVAFAVLSIMMVMFSQGISYATRTGFMASKTRSNSDEAMIKLQDDIISPSGSKPEKVPIGKNGVTVYRQVYKVEVDGKEYTYIVYTSNAN